MRKGMSKIEVNIILVLAIMVLFGVSFLIKFIKGNTWIIYLGMILIGVFVVIAYFQAQEEKKCKKCFSKNTNLIDSKDSIIGWKYMTKKGLPDKRRKNNATMHLVTRKFKCNECEHIFEIESIHER